jgi:hypothetical protein
MTLGYLAFLTPSEAARLLRPFGRTRSHVVPAAPVSGDDAPPATAGKAPPAL